MGSKIQYLDLAMAIDHLSGNWLIRPTAHLRDGCSRNPAIDAKRVWCFMAAMKLFVVYPDSAALVNAAVFCRLL